MINSGCGSGEETKGILIENCVSTDSRLSGSFFMSFNLPSLAEILRLSAHSFACFHSVAGTADFATHRSAGNMCTMQGKE
jgi:hypothetical protein